MSISGFFSYHNIVGETGTNRNFEAWSYGAGVALPDFGKKGNVLGLFAGAEPYACGRVRGANDIPLHVEGFYKYRVSDNISITPGVIWLNAPGQNSDNKDALVAIIVPMAIAPAVNGDLCYLVNTASYYYHIISVANSAIEIKNL